MALNNAKHQLMAAIFKLSEYIYTSLHLHIYIMLQGALALIEKHGIKDGLFLVRKSSRHANAYVLTFSCKGQGFNYEIRSWSAVCFILFCN